MNSGDVSNPAPCENTIFKYGVHLGDGGLLRQHHNSLWCLFTAFILLIIALGVCNTPLHAFELSYHYDLSGQRRDGTKLFDITYELTELGTTDSVNIFVWAITQSGETLAYHTPTGVSGTFQGDTGTVAGPDIYRIIWDIGADAPDREFYSDSIVIHLAAGMSGWEPDSCPMEIFCTAIGGTSDDVGYSVVQTTDGGFAVAGYTDSFGAGSRDFFLVKFSSSGAVSWAKAIGGTEYDRCASVVQTTDGGFAVAGRTSSFGAGGWDFFLVKFSSAGALEWSRTAGGMDADYGYSVVQTTDGGFAVAGYTNSFGAGDYDLFLVKFTSTGAVEWSRAVGGTNYDDGYSVVQTTDGGFAVAGRTESFGAGSADFFLVKFSSAGAVEWSRAVGGTNDDYGLSVVQTTDGGFAVAGYTNSFGAGSYDLFLVKFGILGETCCGEEVFPTIASPSPGEASPSPSEASPSPAVWSVTPTVTDVTPIVTEICP